MRVERRTMTTLRPRILIIDDTPENLELLIAALEVDFDLQVATSGALGLNYAHQTVPDLILLDVMMPDLDGGNLAARSKPIQVGKTCRLCF